MADPKQTLDVWIVESNTVYRDVPYSVVVEWIQQNRLLSDDRLRPSGTQDWLPISELPSFAVYQSRADTFQADDQAEALEPVRLDFGWKRRPADDDEDVDMVPLIDVSLVLLIFFMMTTTVASFASSITPPELKYGPIISSDDQSFWIGIETKNGQRVYSLGQGSKSPEAGAENLDAAGVLALLDKQLSLQEGQVNVRILGDGEMPTGYITAMAAELEKRKNRPTGRGIGKVFNEGSGKDR